MSELTLRRAAHVELHYRILRQLLLPTNAAALDPPAHRAAWAESLTASYQQLPPRQQIALQVLPLWADDLTNYVDRLYAELPPGFADQITLALEESLDRFDDRSWQAQEEVARSCFAAIGPELEQLRALLWAPDTAPALELLDVPALGTISGWSHGRASRSSSGRRKLAISLQQGPEAALMQAFHEECHPISDPQVLQGKQAGARSTQVGSAGYPIHQALERAAVELGQKIVDRQAPAHRAAYARWCARYGIYPGQGS